MKTITIKLTSPLQSFGDQATFYQRTTNSHPTKSAIVGMIAAARGYQRDDPRIESLNDLAFAVRVDQPGQDLKDLQNVEYLKQGKRMRKVTHRSYLQDAIFMVAVGSNDESLIDDIAFALTHPRFQLFLGRRANAPAGPLQIDVKVGDPATVLANVKWQAADWYKRDWHRPTVNNGPDAQLELFADANLLPKQRTQVVKDHVESFDQRDRKFGFRSEARKLVKVVNESHTEGSHDIMGAL